jgi:hypothetical protein
MNETSPDHAGRARNAESISPLAPQTRQTSPEHTQGKPIMVDRTRKRQPDDEDALAAVEYALWLAAPKSEQRYCDTVGHYDPIAEREYRYGYRQGVIDVRRLITDSEHYLITIDSAIADAEEARSEAKSAAQIGVHVPRFRSGTDVVLAKFRGRHFGLLEAEELLDHVHTSDRAVAAIDEWLPLLDAWVNGDCTQYECNPIAPAFGGGH